MRSLVRVNFNAAVKVVAAAPEKQGGPGACRADAGYRGAALALETKRAANCRQNEETEADERGYGISGQTEKGAPVGEQGEQNGLSGPHRDTVKYDPGANRLERLAHMIVAPPGDATG